MKTIEQINGEIAELESRKETLRLEKQAIKKRDRDEEARKRMEEEEAFKSELSKDYDIPRGPKFDRMYSIAYDEGHASGTEAVRNWFSDLAELVKMP